MGFKKNDPSYRRHGRQEDMEREYDNSRKKYDKIRQERKRSKEYEDNLFRHVRDYKDLLEADLDNLN